MTGKYRRRKKKQKKNKNKQPKEVINLKIASNTSCELAGAGLARLWQRGMCFDPGGFPHPRALTVWFALLLELMM